MLSRIKSMQSEGHAMLSQIILCRPCRTGIGQTRGLSLHAAYRPSPITFLLPVPSGLLCQFGRNARRCRDRPRVCPIPIPMPMPIRSTDRITIFRACSVVWYLLCRPCRAEGRQQITPRGLSDTHANSVYRPHNLFRLCSVVCYLLCRPCRAVGRQQITPRGLSLHTAYRPSGKPF